MTKFGKLQNQVVKENKIIRVKRRYYVVDKIPK